MNIKRKLQQTHCHFSFQIGLSKAQVAKKDRLKEDRLKDDRLKEELSEYVEPPAFQSK